MSPFGYLLVLILFTQSLVHAQNLRIVIDPGHGGSDLGATRDTFVESKIVLEVAKKVKLRLEELLLNDTHLTRESDKTLSLKERVQLANNIGANLYISLHANTSTSNNLSGMEFYFSKFKPLKPVSSFQKNKPTNNEVVAQIINDFNEYHKIEKSLNLSQLIQKQVQVKIPTEAHDVSPIQSLAMNEDPRLHQTDSKIASSLNLEKKTIIKQASFYVLENTQMPSVLVELGFISNRREAKKLTNPHYQNELANKIAMAILEYKKSNLSIN